MRKNFVFGNGRTRLNINFDDVRPYGLIYACNAVYREYKPDFLVAVDRKMIDEINNNQYQITNQVWTWPFPYKSTHQNFNFIDENLGWSSGPTALFLSASYKPNEIYIFGFDFEGLEGKLNNVYADTKNYKSSKDSKTYYGNWYKQTEKVIKDNSDIQFIRVTIPNFYEPKWKYDNYKEITYEELYKIMSKWKQIR
ncbi:MAG: hypothetical protein EBT86_08150 [Actinobacteria bacterium]|nr:hypothetical protein [Actinomycetota bacterium]